MVTDVVSVPASARVTVTRFVCSIAHPSAFTDVTDMLSVALLLSHGTTIAVTLPWPWAYCSMASASSFGVPFATNSSAIESATHPINQQSAIPCATLAQWSDQ